MATMPPSTPLRSRAHLPHSPDDDSPLPAPPAISAAALMARSTSAAGSSSSSSAASGSGSGAASGRAYLFAPRIHAAAASSRLAAASAAHASSSRLGAAAAPQVRTTLGSSMGLSPSPPPLACLASSSSSSSSAAPRSSRSPSGAGASSARSSSGSASPHAPGAASPPRSSSGSGTYAPAAATAPPHARAASHASSTSASSSARSSLGAADGAAAAGVAPSSSTAAAAREARHALHAAGASVARRSTPSPSRSPDLDAASAAFASTSTAATAAPAAAPAYETPAMARSLRAGAGTLRSLATAAPRSVGRALRSTGRTSSAHVPARRVLITALEPEAEDEEAALEEERREEQASPVVRLGADEEEEEELEPVRAALAASQPAPLRSEAHPAAAAAAARRQPLGAGFGLGMPSALDAHRLAPAPPTGGAAERAVSVPTAAAPAAAAAARAPLGASSRVNVAAAAAPHTPLAHAAAKPVLSQAAVLQPLAPLHVQPLQLEEEEEDGGARDEAMELRLKLEAHDLAHYQTALASEIARQAEIEDFVVRDRRHGKGLAACKETTFRGQKFAKLFRAGEGGFSSVWAVRGPLNRAVALPDGSISIEAVPEAHTGLFAMKHISLKRLEPHCRTELLKEVETLQALAQEEGNERHILKYFGHKLSGSALKILIEVGDQDFAKHLSLGPLTQAQIRTYWMQMLEAVQFIHVRAHLVHTDLKPANFLLVGARLKLIDFGIAQKIPLGTVHISRDQIIGTPNYMAPETILCARGQGGVYKAGMPSDVWSLGCILYQMVYGRPPFDGIASDRKLERITDRAHVIPFPSTRTPAADAEEVAPSLLASLRAALRYDALRRATIHMLLDDAFARPRTITFAQDEFRDLVKRLALYVKEEEMDEAQLDQLADRAFSNSYAKQQQQHS